MTESAASHGCSGRWARQRPVELLQRRGTPATTEIEEVAEHSPPPSPPSPSSPEMHTALPLSITETYYEEAPVMRRKVFMGASLHAARVASALQRLESKHCGSSAAPMVSEQVDEIAGSSPVLQSPEGGHHLKSTLRGLRFAVATGSIAKLPTGGIEKLPEGRAVKFTPNDALEQALHRPLQRKPTTIFGSASFGPRSFKVTDNKDFLAESQRVHRHIKKLTGWTFSPDGSFIKKWDLVLLTMLLFTATVGPFEVSFIMLDDGPFALFVMNRVVDVVFLVDIVFNFFIPFRQSAKEGGRWVYNTKRIARHYLRGWFALDCVTAVPMDLLMLGAVDHGSTAARSVKILKLLKMARMLRLKRIVRRWLARVQTDLSVLELVKYLVITVFVAHWLACGWGFVGNNLSESKDPINLDTWYVEDYRTLSWIQKHQLTDAKPLELYCVALYVALSNIFGGPCEISPANYGEFLVQSVMMLIGSSLWAYIIGCGCNIIDTLYPYEEEHRRVIAVLNNFARERKIDPELTQRLRTFYNETSNLRYFENRESELLHAMTPQLRGESALVASKEIFWKVPFLRNDGMGIEPDFLAKASLRLTTAVYCAREHIRCELLGIVVRGLVSSDGRVGVKTVGEDMIIQTKALRQTMPAIALTIVQLRTLDRSALFDLLVEYPIAQVRVRKHAVLITLQRLLLRAAEAATLAKTYQGTALTLKDAFEWVRSDIASHQEPETFDVPDTGRQVESVDHKVDQLSKRVDHRMDRLEESMREMLANITNEMRTAAAPRVHQRPRPLSKGKSAPPPRGNAGGPLRGHPHTQPRSPPEILQPPSLHLLPSVGHTADQPSGRASPADERLAARDDLYGA